MTRVRTYRDLRVYRQSFRWAMALKRLTETFPDEERFDLVRQVRRSSRSVCANLAEAWRRRMYPAAFAAKLIDAEAEATETRVHIELALACEYVDPETAERIDQAYDQILAQLAAMRAHPERWTPRPRHRAHRPKQSQGPGGRFEQHTLLSPPSDDAGASGGNAAHTDSTASSPSGRTVEEAAAPRPKPHRERPR